MEEIDYQKTTKIDDERMFGKSSETVSINEFSKEFDTKEMEKSNFYNLAFNYLIPVAISSSFLVSLLVFGAGLVQNQFKFLVIATIAIITISFCYVVSFFLRKYFWLFFILLGLPIFSICIYLIFLAK